MSILAVQATVFIQQLNDLLRAFLDLPWHLRFTFFPELQQFVIKRDLELPINGTYVVSVSVKGLPVEHLRF